MFAQNDARRGDERGSQGEAAMIGCCCCPARTELKADFRGVCLLGCFIIFVVVVVVAVSVGSDTHLAVVRAKTTRSRTVDAIQTTECHRDAPINALNNIRLIGKERSQRSQQAKLILFVLQSFDFDFSCFFSFDQISGATRDKSHRRRETFTGESTSFPVATSKTTGRLVDWQRASNRVKEISLVHKHAH